MMLATVNNRSLLTFSSVLYFELLLFMKLIDDSSSEMSAVYTKLHHAMHSLREGEFACDNGGSQISCILALMKIFIKWFLQH